MLHALKCIQPYFKYIQDGIKQFEVRKDDRPFGEGDDLVLQEWDEANKKYTGHEWYGKITMILRDAEWCKKGYCIMSIKAKESDY